MSAQIKIYKVSEVNKHIKRLILGDSWLSDIWVEGEISNFKHHRSGHMYFTVKDSASTLRCVFFRRENSRCLFKPTDGMNVILHGNISVYEPDGIYQFYVSEMEASGVGSLFVAFEKLKKMLEAEGLFREEHKKKLPFIPRKIGLITSPSGAALQDILTTIQNRFPHVQLLIVESLVQGPGASADIVRALNVLNRKVDIELIILTRGGGSLEDLWPFNDENVARAIYNSSKPVITAIGHETDFTIADFVADYRAPTPTAAAVTALPDLEELLISLQKLQDRAKQAIKRQLQIEKQLLDSISSERIFRIPLNRLRLSREILEDLNANLKREIVRSMQLKGVKLSALLDRFESYSPMKIMSRGYSFCQDEHGNIVRSVKNIQIGMLLKLKFVDGRATCRAEQIEEEPSNER